MLVCAFVNYTLTFIMVISKHLPAKFQALELTQNLAALMVIKGGDVEQLLATDYVQPYVQIVFYILVPLERSPTLTHCSFTT
jgi:hypothetical protein